MTTSKTADCRPPTVDSTPGPRWLYLHGFASGPDSTKGVAIAAHYAKQGIHVERLDLRVPSFERLSLAEILRVAQSAIGAQADRAILFGSSLGGLAACRVAEMDARVCALVLMAPAFRLFDRWRSRLGDEVWRAWQTTGWLEIEDHAADRASARVHFDFVREAAIIDERSGGWPDVRVPTLIVHGTRDDVVDVELSRTWAKGKRHVRLVEVDDGHELVASIPRIQQEADEHLAGFLVDG